MYSVWSFTKRFRLLLSATIFAVYSLGGFLYPGVVNAISSGSIISLTNSERSAAGLGPLSYNGLLSSSAYMKAQDMLAKNYWAHTSPDGLTGAMFVLKAGYKYTFVGENLASGYTSDAAVISGWMNSPTHRANILNQAYKDIGVAVVTGTLLGKSTTLVVAHYGATTVSAAPKPKPISAPKPTTITPKIAPQPAPQPAPQAAPKPSPSNTEPIATTPPVTSNPGSSSKPVPEPFFRNVVEEFIRLLLNILPMSITREPIVVLLSWRVDQLTGYING